MNKIIPALVCAIGLFATSSVFAQTQKEEEPMENSNILIAYYSHSGNTKAVTEAIQKQVGGTLFEIKIDDTYPNDYHQMTEQAQKEIESGFRPPLRATVPDIAAYDTVFWGSPNWWGTIAPAVSSFIEAHALSGKKIIPVITNGGGGVQNTISDMTKQGIGCHVVQEGWVSYGNSTKGLEEWLKPFKK